MTEPDLHPLINKNSNYYNEAGKKTGIEEFEETYSVRDIMAWARITAHKYRLDGRKGKGEQDKDIIKEATYTNYHNMLKALVIKDHTIFEMSPSAAYKRLNIVWRFQ